MKIRQGFVSNSSSSSFVMIGYGIQMCDECEQIHMQEARRYTLEDLQHAFDNGVIEGIQRQAYGSVDIDGLDDFDGTNFSPSDLKDYILMWE